MRHFSAHCTTGQTSRFGNKISNLKISCFLIISCLYNNFNVYIFETLKKNISKDYLTQLKSHYGTNELYSCSTNIKFLC